MLAATGRARRAPCCGNAGCGAATPVARQLRPVTGPGDAVGACAVVCCVAPQRRVAIGRAHVAVTAASNALAVAVVYEPRVTCGTGTCAVCVCLAVVVERKVALLVEEARALVVGRTDPHPVRVGLGLVIVLVNP